MKNLLFLLSLLAAGCGGHYTNPLDVAFGDPFVLAASDGRFYMYGTSEGAAGFRVCVSDDLGSINLILETVSVLIVFSYNALAVTA